ncbi:hypothetical protein [Nibricoccus sp. IMCC34717]|uniref:hypothetical protein n=1 Tax=Nibricoccus sp. IMCC34717 TaxID=3034021 RepID=UPI00384AED13
MEESLWSELQNLRPTLRQRWEVLLRAQPPSSPLANPDSLVFLMDWTFDQFFTELRKVAVRSQTRQRAGMARCPERRVPCACGMNPLLAYFQTAELALIETVLPLLAPQQQEPVLQEIKAALGAVSKREIEAFCAVCRRRAAEMPAESRACNGVAR